MTPQVNSHIFLIGWYYGSQIFLPLTSYRAMGMGEGSTFLPNILPIIASEIQWFGFWLKPIYANTKLHSKLLITSKVVIL